MPLLIAFDTLTELYKELTTRFQFSDKIAFARKTGPGEPYSTITWDHVQQDVMSLACAMVDMGVGKGDRIAILSENRYEWVVVDLAIQMLGAVNVSLYTTLPPKQCEFIINDSESKLFFVSTTLQLKKAVEIFDDCPKLERVIAFDTPKNSSLLEHEWVGMFDSLLAHGQMLESTHSSRVNDASEQVRPEDVATLIYTSGTTGNPKGAMLTHGNICSNVKAAHKSIDITEQDRSLSFLPLCHSFERTGGYYAMIGGGAEIWYAESVDTVAKNMLEAHPTIVISVPRLFEKIYNTVTKSVEEGSAVKRSMFNWALGVGQRYSEGRRGIVSLQKAIADKLVFSKLHQKTGGRIRFFVSGGAALPADIGSFFQNAGLPILEGYGLTETSPVMCVNQFGHARMGTVGFVVDGVTVGIMDLNDHRIIASLSGASYPSNLTSEAGEILCKGPNVMKGYWNNGQATREMIDDDGWLHTGDVGRFVDGRLVITDRIKHMIVNAGGKNIYPGPIEDMFKTSKWIEQIMVVGEGKAFMGALIVPSLDNLKAFAAENNIPTDSVDDMLGHPAVQAVYHKTIRDFSKDLASHEKVRDFRLIANEFTVDNGEMTPTMKLKRRVIESRYAVLIEEMFSDSNDASARVPSARNLLHGIRERMRRPSRAILTMRAGQSSFDLLAAMND
jgi:long-chain acyl-CoA synthetase